MKTPQSIPTAALALDPDQLLTFLLELKLVKNNAELAAAAIEKHAVVLGKTFQNYVSPVPRFLSLLGALEEATQAVDAAKPKSGDAKAKTTVIYADRDVLLGQIQSFAKFGWIPMPEVDRIVAGHGPIDAAEDVVEMAKLFDTYPITKTKRLNTEAEVEAMVGRAKEYLFTARPSDFHAPPNDVLVAAVDMQSRVWTLMVKQHDVLWRYGAFLFGKNVDEQIMPLGSRLRMAKKVEAEPAPTPTPEPVS